MSQTFLKQTLNYYSASIIAALFNLTLYSFFIYSFKIHYLVSAVIAFFIANALNYLLNRRLAFKNSKSKLIVAYFKSFLVALTALTIIVILTKYCVESLRLDFLISRIVSGIIAGLVSYGLDTNYSFV